MIDEQDILNRLRERPAVGYIAAQTGLDRAIVKAIAKAHRIKTIQGFGSNLSAEDAAAHNKARALHMIATQGGNPMRRVHDRAKIAPKLYEALVALVAQTRDCPDGDVMLRARAALHEAAPLMGRSHDL